MKTKVYSITFLALIIILLLTTNCQMSKKVDHFKADAAEMEVLAGKNIAKGLMLGFLQDSIQLVLNHKLDSIMKTVDGHLKYTSQGLRDTILGDYTALWMQKRLLDIQTSLASSRTELLGSKTKYMISELRNELMGDATVMRLAAMRNELLGKKTSVLLDSIIQSSITAFATGYKVSIKPELASTVTTTLDSANGTIKNLKALLWTMGLVSAGLMVVGGLMFMRYRKHRELVKVLTKEIDGMPSKDAYDELVDKVEMEAKKRELNDQLNEILKEQYLPGKKKWKEMQHNHDKEVALFLGNFINKCKELNDPDSAKLINELRREAVKQNMEKEFDRIVNLN